jgi:hypothetical protein
MLKVNFSNGSSLKEMIVSYSKPIPDAAIAGIQLEMQNNFTRIWESRGASIGVDWGDSTLIKTGNLKAWMTGPMGITVTANSITKQNYNPYGQYVNMKKTFMVFDDNTARNIFSIIRSTRELSRR